MHDDVRNALRSGIENALGALREHSVVGSELSLVWKKGESGQWSGSWDQVPALSLGFGLFPMSEYAEEVDRLLHLHHPDYCGLVGSPSLGQSNVPMGQRLGKIIHHLWSLHGDFDVPVCVVDEVLGDIAAFFDSPTLEIEFTAPLLNFSGPPDTDHIDLAPGLSIVRLTSDQVTSLFGGSPFMPSHPSARHFFPLEWALSGTITEPKLLGEQKDPRTPSSRNELRERLDRGLLALRTFRSGPVGHDFVRLAPSRFTPYVWGGVELSFGDTYVPFGGYVIDDNEVEPLQRHALLMNRPLHASLESACRRLSDGEIRLQARDKIFDAVVGLEAILLADSSEKYRGELRYRFAMNYAALFDPPSERLEAFRLARRLYDLRSDIAHGTPLPDTVTLAGKPVALGEVGTRACEMLRNTIQKFLPESGNPSYLAGDYWPIQHFRRSS